MTPMHVTERSTWLLQGHGRVGMDKQFLELVPKVLLHLYEPPSEHIPHHGKVLRRTLAACRLVCRRWSKIVKSTTGRFIILAYNKEWPSPSFSYYIIQRAPPLLHDERECDFGWLHKNYTPALINSHPKLLPELVPDLVAGLDRCSYIPSYGTYLDEVLSSIPSTLATWCLVSREWNKVFTPTLYEEIFLGGKKPLLTQSLLHHTFRWIKPARKSLVKTMTIEPAEDGSTANLLSICFSMPNLCKLIIKPGQIHPAALHPNFAQALRSLSRYCTIQTWRKYSHVIDTDSRSPSSWNSFARRSRVTQDDVWFFIGERRHTELVQGVLLRLNESPDNITHRQNALRGSLAARRLVPRQWDNVIVESRTGQFITLPYNPEFPSLSFSYYIFRNIPPPLHDEGEGRSDSGWLPNSYLTTPANLRLAQYLLELLPNMVLGLDRHSYITSYGTYWDEGRSSRQSTLATWCLVCREWNWILTRVLYAEIFIGGKEPLLTQSLLHNTLRRTKSAHKSLVKTMTIEPAEDGSTANLLSICFSMPNLRKLILRFERIYPAVLHPNFAQSLRSLSRYCAVQMGRGHDDTITTKWESLPRWISFVRLSQLAPCRFRVDSPDPVFYSATHFHVGKQEASVSGFINSSGIPHFKRHLTRTGRRLKGLHLSRHNASPIPEINLSRHRHLQFLQFSLRLKDEGGGESRDDVIRSFTSICESVTSKSLVVEVYGLTDESDICNKIQDTLLALRARLGAFSLYLSEEHWDEGILVNKEDIRKLFSKLYEKGVVVEKFLYSDESRALAFC